MSKQASQYDTGYRKTIAEAQATREHLRTEMFKDLKPEGEREEQLAHTIVDSIWNYQRASALENNLLSAHMQKREGSIQTGDEEIDRALLMADAFRAKSRELAKLALYSERMEDRRMQARKELDRLQAMRPRNTRDPRKSIHLV